VKRAYAEVRVVATEGGFAVALDDRPVKTPGRWPLLLPTRGLAEGIALEWREQGTTVRPDTIKLMQLAATVLDRAPTDRAAVEQAVLRFAGTDLVCYRADRPPELVRRQRAHWEPLLDWLAETHGAHLAITAGVMPVVQSPDALDTLARIVADLDRWQLGAFQAGAAAAGSFVIALALIEGRIDSDQAFAAAELDESFEIARWGEDVEATKRRDQVAADLAAARRFLELLGG
jgi:chaperone required for assembly of F1-ATPase